LPADGPLAWVRIRTGGQHGRHARDTWPPHFTRHSAAYGRAWVSPR